MMVLLHQAVRVLLVLFLSTESCYYVQALPGGAPASACVSLTPMHGPGIVSQTTQPPYEVDTTPFSNGLGGLFYIPDTTYQC